MYAPLKIENLFSTNYNPTRHGEYYFSMPFSYMPANIHPIAQDF